MLNSEVPETMTCNAGCEMERFHPGPCRTATGLDTDLLNEIELAILNETGTAGGAFGTLLGRHTAFLLTTICNLRRQLLRNRGEQ